MRIRARPAIEVVNCRIADWDVTSFDFVADNSAAEFVVMRSETRSWMIRNLDSSLVLMVINVILGLSVMRVTERHF